VARYFTDENKSPELYFVLEIFWGLWFVMPLLVGCAAVAEERKLGTHEQQLCLPVKRRTQFGIKLVVVLGLSLLLGVAMPLVFEGARIFPAAHFEIGRMHGDEISLLSPTLQNIFIVLETLDAMLPMLILALVALVTCTVSFYVSTLARNTLQSLAPAVLGIMLTVALLAAVGQPWNYWSNYLWSGPLPYFILTLVMALTLLVLAAKNFKLTRPTLRNGGLNVLVLLGAIILSGVLTSAVYHRFWEKLTPFESAHGAARLSQKDAVRLGSRWNDVSARLPDGKIWKAAFDYERSSVTFLSILSGKVTARLNKGTFYAGSNWVNIRRYGIELAGVKTDGTLWISELPQTTKKRVGYQWEADESKMGNLLQFGTETNWCSASPSYASTLLVKTDGSLWRLGTNHFDQKRSVWPGLRAFVPARLGTDSDWAMVGEDYYQFAMFKTNGSIWTPVNGSSTTNGLTTIEIEPNFSVTELYDGRHGIFRSLTQIQHGLQYKAGIREDGTFRIWADMHLEMKPHRYGYYEWAPTDLQIGTGTNWLTLAGGGEKVVTLKDDGTLWLWDFRDRSHRGWEEQWSRQEVLKTVPTQLGTHSDWIAVSGHSTFIVALAADGGLWFWPVENMGNYFGNNGNGSNIRPWLDVSRKPQLLGNIFAQAK
jgi:alpha-tubulin suppressor-like RCC1 family protein